MLHSNRYSKAIRASKLYSDDENSHLSVVVSQTNSLPFSSVRPCHSEADGSDLENQSFNGHSMYQKTLKDSTMFFNKKSSGQTYNNTNDSYESRSEISNYTKSNQAATEHQVGLINRLGPFSNSYIGGHIYQDEEKIQNVNKRLHSNDNVQPDCFW